MTTHTNQIDFGAPNIRKTFTSIFFPTLLGMIFNMSFILVDGILVGHGIGSHGLSSINLIAPIMMLINGLGMMFGIGASVMSAIQLSQGNKDGARQITTQAFVSGCILAILIGLVCYIFPMSIITLLGTKGNLIPYVTEYYLWFVPTCLFTMIQAIGLFAIRLDGSPKFAMMANLIPAVINGVLDYLFIFPCGMGLKGAALATDIGSGVGAIMVFYYMIFKSHTLKPYRLDLSIKNVLPNIGKTIHIAKIGLPGLVGEAAVGVLTLVGNIQFIKHMGEDGIAAYSIACYLFPLVYMLCNAVAQSAQPIISYNCGANRPRQVEKAFRYSLRIGIISGIVVSALFILFPAPISSAFIDKSVSAFPIIEQGLPYFSVTFVFLAINMCYIGYYQSIEKSRTAIIFTILRGCVILIISFITMPYMFGEIGLWLAAPVTEAITTVAIVMYRVITTNKNGHPQHQ